MPALGWKARTAGVAGDRAFRWGQAAQGPRSVIRCVTRVGNRQGRAAPERACPRSSPATRGARAAAEPERGCSAEGRSRFVSCVRFGFVSCSVDRCGHSYVSFLIEISGSVFSFCSLYTGVALLCTVSEDGNVKHQLSPTFYFLIRFLLWFLYSFYCCGREKSNHKNKEALLSSRSRA